MYSHKLLGVSLAASLLVLSGCSSSGGGGGVATVDPQIPAGAIVIDDKNAVTVAEFAGSTTDTISDISGASGADIVDMPSARNAIDQVTKLVFDKDRTNAVAVASGVTDTIPCTFGGSITDTYTETSTGYSGTVVFNNCNEGFVFNGGLNYSDSFDNITGDFTGTANGRFTFTNGNATITIELDTTVNGNLSTGDISTNFSYSYSAPGMGFLVTTPTPLSGSLSNIPNPIMTTGTLLVQGANGTALRLTLDGQDGTTATLEIDTGSGFVPHPTSPTISLIN